MSDFGMCRSLIEAAKGAEPDGGFVTDHLDAAEVWLDKIEETVEAQAAEIEKLREALEAVWKEATMMRKASKLVGPYPTQPEKNRLWARSMYHAGKRIMEMLKPIRAALGETK